MRFECQDQATDGESSQDNQPNRWQLAGGLPYLILGERHLRRVLTEYVTFYNEARPYQGLAQRCPIALPPPVRAGPVRRRDRLGGLLHDYYREAA